MDVFTYLVNAAKKYVRSHQDAEDIAQNILLEYWKKHHVVPNIGDGLSTLVSWRCYDYYKFRRRKKRIKELSAENLENLGVCGRKRAQCLGLDLDDIPIKFMGLVSLKLQGYTNEEIADASNCSERHIRRELNRLRWYLLNKTQDQ